MDFSKWTKADFQAFDAKRQEVFAPTKQEIDIQKQARTDELVANAQKKLSQYNITLRGDETDFKDLYTLYIKGDGSNQNKDMSEWLGDEKELDKILQHKIKNENNLESFVAFVTQYE